MAFPLWRISLGGLLAIFSLMASLLVANPARAASDSTELFELANAERSAVGLQPLLWDKALAAAAYDHALRMAATSSISHQYQDEPGLAERTSAAGAHFSLIEENIAAGSTGLPIQVIHDGWMHSRGHRENLLNPDINRVGLAVVVSRGHLFAVADYSKFTEPLTQVQVEFAVGRLLRKRGLGLVDDPIAARRYCGLNGGGLTAETRDAETGQAARFGMRWQASDISSLPRQLEDHVATGRFHRAAVGGCSPVDAGAGGQSGFSSYRVGVILY